MSDTTTLVDVVTSYVGLISLATASIYFGSYASLPIKKRDKKEDSSEGEEDDEDEEEEPLSEEIRIEDAYWFPIIGSVLLLSLYLIIKYISVAWINVIIQWYFSIITVASLWKLLISTSKFLIGSTRWRSFSQLTFSLHQDKTALVRLQTKTLSLLLFPLAIYPSIIYVFFPKIMERQHTVIINTMSLSLCHMALSTIKLDSLITGVVLLSGLFFYDVWWVFGSKSVFGSNVMVTVARGLDAPIKILWPKSRYFDASQGCTMLGLGDIVVPGVFIALALRYDLHRSTHRNYAQPFSKPFFTVTLISYVLGLITTVIIMHIFQSAQPALLYLSPACILAFLGTGSVLGLWKDMWSFSDTKDKTEEQDSQSPKGSKHVNGSAESKDVKESENSTAPAGQRDSEKDTKSQAVESSQAD